MRIEFHGGLRDFFPTSKEYQLAQGLVAGELLQLLQKENPLAGNLLLNTRIADNARILDNDARLENAGTYHLLPPPGGG
jgi:hypothetical protein